MRTIKFIMLFLFILSCNTDGVNNNANYGNLPSYGKVKDFNIENFEFSKLNNKVWLFNLFFTSCHGPCPVTMANLRKVQEKNKELTIVSLSVDPQKDTPQAISEFVKDLGIDTTNWHLISTNAENRKKIIEDNFEITDMEKVSDHSARVFLIDGKQEVRGSYVGTLGIDIEKLERDLAKLL